jgi:hypothetical protein
VALLMRVGCQAEGQGQEVGRRREARQVALQLRPVDSSADNSLGRTVLGRQQGEGNVGSMQRNSWGHSRLHVGAATLPAHKADVSTHKCRVNI